MTRAIVLGGGVAGLTAAFALRDLGHEVELVESRGWLGGRAFSLPKQVGSRRPDNGPHVMLGCYVRMRELLRRIGTEDAFDRPKSLTLRYATDEGVDATLALSRLPAPIALPWAILRMQGVPKATRWQALKGMLKVGLGARSGESLADWLERRGQLGGARSWFWDPLCRAIMNAEAEFVAARSFVRTLRIAFSGGAARAAIWSPLRPWADILGDPARARLEREGVTVSTGSRVTGLRIASGILHGIECGDRTIEVGVDDAVFSALPWHTFAPFVGDSSAGGIESSPIVSVYFEFDRVEGIPADPVVGLVDGDPFHFLCRAPGAPVEQFALLSGGNRSLDGVAVDEIEARAKAQLLRHFPSANVEGGVARVVKENLATFIAAPGQRRARPLPGRYPAARNLWVCGDWTWTKLPATLEGAARSAHAAVAAYAKTR